MHIVKRVGSLAAAAVLVVACQAGTSPTNAPTTSPTNAPTAASSQGGASQATGAIAPKNGSQYVVGWSPISDPVDPTRTTFDNEIKAPIEALGTKYLYCSAANDPTKQAGCVDSFITQNADAIIVWPVDLVAIQDSIKKANAANIPVFVFFGKIDASSGAKVMLSVASAGVAASKNAGEYIISALTKKYGTAKGTVLEVGGTQTQLDGIMRHVGFANVMSQYPDVKVTTKDASWDASKAATIIQDWLTANPNTDAIYSGTDCSYLPDEVLKSLNRWVKIGDPKWIAFTGMDGCNQMLWDIKCGYHEQTTDIGYAALPRALGNAVANYLKTGQLPKAGDTIQTGNPTFKTASVAQDDGVSGPTLSIDPVIVTAANVADPELNGNKFMQSPNGLGPACS